MANEHDHKVSEKNCEVNEKVYAGDKEWEKKQDFGQYRQYVQTIWGARN